MLDCFPVATYIFTSHKQFSLSHLNLFNIIFFFTSSQCSLLHQSDANLWMLCHLLLSPCFIVAFCIYMNIFGVHFFIIFLFPTTPFHPLDSGGSGSVELFPSIFSFFPFPRDFWYFALTVSFAYFFYRLEWYDIHCTTVFPPLKRRTLQHCLFLR